MGNSNLIPTTIQNLNFEKINSLVIPQDEEDNYKRNIRSEKKNEINM